MIMLIWPQLVCLFVIALRLMVSSGDALQQKSWTTLWGGVVANAIILWLLNAGGFWEVLK